MWTVYGYDLDKWKFLGLLFMHNVSGKVCEEIEKEACITVAARNNQPSNSFLPYPASMIQQNAREMKPGLERTISTGMQVIQMSIIRCRHLPRQPFLPSLPFSPSSPSSFASSPPSPPPSHPRGVSASCWHPQRQFHC